MITDKGRLRAYSLIEVLVALALSSITIYMSYWLISAVSQYWDRVQSNQNHLVEEKMGLYQLADDFMQSSGIRHNSDTIVFHVQGKEVKYFRESELTCRISGMSHQCLITSKLVLENDHASRWQELRVINIHSEIILRRRKYLGEFKTTSQTQ